MKIKRIQAPIIEIFKAILVAEKNFKLYGKEHEQTQMSFENLVETINVLRIDDECFNIDRVSDQWLIYGYPANELNKIGEDLADIYKQKKIDRLQIDYPTNIEKVGCLIEFLAMKDFPTEKIKGFKIASVTSNTDGTQFGKNYRLERISDNHPIYLDMRKIYNNYHNNKEVDVAATKEISRAFVQAFSVARNPLKFLANVKYEDEYTYVHTIDVALLTMGLAIATGVPRELLNDITFAALMHDVGKMMVPNEILNFPGRLNDEQMAIMQSHSLKGAIYLAESKEMPKVSVVAALEHHINYDGGGYPVLGEDYKRHIISQLISVADIYDALRSNRPYRKSMPNERVLQIMREESGKKLNPQLVDIFINLVSQWQ